MAFIFKKLLFQEAKRESVINLKAAGTRQTVRGKWECVDAEIQWCFPDLVGERMPDRAEQPALGGGGCLWALISFPGFWADPFHYSHFIVLILTHYWWGTQPPPPLVGGEQAKLKFLWCFLVKCVCVCVEGGGGAHAQLGAKDSIVCVYLMMQSRALFQLPSHPRTQSS